jgi:hypothetical protein
MQLSERLSNSFLKVKMFAISHCIESIAFEVIFNNRKATFDGVVLRTVRNIHYGLDV